ncbi:MAG: sacsin N-terminal ATP-binding-like domain-containing protein, partial [Candidatus Bathyarchaeia archaeon]
MFETFYDRIRKENIGKYGTEVSVYGPVLLANLYSDRTHFLYEILQNAEDACERARKKGSMKKFFIKFSLLPDRLEVRHNGIPFDENDVRGICGIVGSIKDKNVSQIGKFGIGFKSVYAFTNCPEIHSGDKFFSIRDYVYPYPVKASEDLNPQETLIVIRFEEASEKQKQAHLEIENRLKRLGIRSFLFLKNLEQITYNVDSTNGSYVKSYETKMGIKTVALKYIE